MTASELALKTYATRPHPERPLNPDQMLLWSPVRHAEIILSPSLKRRLVRTLEVAQTSTPVPFQSGFYVFTGVAVQPGPWMQSGDEGIVTGGNIEYALSDAAHGEETGVYRAIGKYGVVPIQAVGFYTHNQRVDEKTFADPCGGCRDRLRPYCSPEMYFVQGGINDMISVTQFRDYLFDTPTLVDHTNLDPSGRAEAVRGLKNGVSVYLPDALKQQMYGAAIVTDDGKVWSGSHWVNAGYDAVPAFNAALQAWRNMSPQSNIAKIVIAGEGSIPLPLYADRQDMLELGEALNLYLGRDIKKPLPVELLQVSDSGVVVAAALSNTVEMLPHPFSAGSFGMMDALREYMSVLR